MVFNKTVIMNKQQLEIEIEIPKRATAQPKKTVLIVPEMVTQLRKLLAEREGVIITVTD